MAGMVEKAGPAKMTRRHGMAGQQKRTMHPLTKSKAKAAGKAAGRTFGAMGKPSTKGVKGRQKKSILSSSKSDLKGKLF